MKRALIFIGLLACLSCNTDNSEVVKKFKTIMIKTSARMEVAPNMATFNIRLKCNKPTTTLSKDCLVKKSENLNKTLLSFGIVQDDIQTNSVDMRKDYYWNKGKRIFRGYIASTRTFVTVKNIDSLDQLYTKLLENKNLDLNGLNYAHSKIDSLKNEAYSKALMKAGVTADKLLEGMPETEKEILKIGNIGISSSVPSENKSRFKESDNMIIEQAEIIEMKPITISSGKIKVQATLYVEYLIN